MAKFAFSFDADRIIIVNEATNKVDDKLELLEHVELSQAFRVLSAGRKADAKASDVSISMLADVMQSPVLDEYKGKTPANEKVPSTMLAAVRDVENDIFKKAYVQAHIDKGATPSKADALWQEFRKSELTTGSYSNAKSYVCKMFAHMGQLPIAPNGKLLPLHAIKRMYDTWKASQETGHINEGVAGKLIKLSSEIENRTEKTELGDYASAIAALKSMLATYEGLYAESLERLTEIIGNPANDVQQGATDAIQSAMNSRLASEFESLKTQWENGEIDDVTFQIKAEELGFTVDLVSEETDEAPF